ncbi:GNAT family N-acetyltransferase [Rossellomorea marisflavi]|uniref:GNAT family N-acetyltransferase n=2 Tax=Rossellomorea marisflavi TaxID=189381 RepID=UPI001F3D0F49|nr:GNAT family protein [Rossellomorea marisflavi]UTE73738.1 GNAT family N-acetyltransferase [Rossellomorea marisflavi]
MIRLSYTLRKRTDQDIQEFITWRYEGNYSFYDNPIQEEKVNGFLESGNREGFYSVIDREGRLAGNCEFFQVGDETEDIMGVGIQMKPALTGKGEGRRFFHSIIEEGRRKLGYDHLELAVVDFNVRAISVYERAGFVQKGEFQNNIRGQEYRFIIMEKDW